MSDGSPLARLGAGALGVARGRWGRALGAGLIAGLVGGALFTIVLVLLRLGPGVPLPLELFTDFFLPRQSVGRFLDTLEFLGGFMAAKELALQTSFLAQMGVALGLGAAYALLVERARARPSPRGLVGGLLGRPALLLSGVLLLFWLAFVLVVRAELDQNFRGLPPASARVAAVFGLLFAILTVVAGIVLAHRLITRARPLHRPDAGEAPPPASDGTPIGRRALLLGAAGGVLAVVGGGLVRRYDTISTLDYDGQVNLGRNLPAITPNDRFYTVTKNITDPRVRRSLWRLEVNGAVASPVSMDLDELMALPAREREITLACISNSVGGGLISNAVWRGVPVRDLLDMAEVQPQARALLLHGVDGFTHELSLEMAMKDTTLVVYTMNGEPLPHRHGYPVRILVPGAYGELSVKWLTRIEVRTQEALGFFGRQGWDADRVRTLSRIDRPSADAKLEARRPQRINGIAFSGDRGISAVEVSADGGQSWRPARIDHHTAPTAWALWSLSWTPPRAGDHELVVRAREGDGTMQEERERGIAPSGASGYHRVMVSVA